MVVVNIKIKRKTSDNENSYFQTFKYEGNINSSIAFVLEEINSREKIIDIEDNFAERIKWDCGCLQRKCGACAMIINGNPALACSSLLKDLIKDDNNLITIEPLSKFPVVSDLNVDKDSIFKSLKDMKLYLESESKINKNQHESEYQSSRCLMCGCCLEICPNFDISNTFSGALSMVNGFKLINQENENNHKNEMIQEYRKHYYNGCGKSLSCEDICPLNLPIEQLLSKSNAVGVWGRKLK